MGIDAVGGADAPSTGRTRRRALRLEFLGDRVLGLVVAEWLHDHYPDEDEGESQIRHSGLVRTEALVAVAGGLRLDGHVRAKSHGLWVSRSNSNDTMVADALEAIVGAVFVDGGYAASKRVGMHPSKRAASMAAAKILAELEAEARKGRRKKKYENQLS
ncbi:ribonuclease III [Aureococcus anophagefferens]|nr:ribonuclease III [Aureococcus anophagefferens]